MSFRITQKQHAIQRASVLEDLRKRTEQEAIPTRKRLFEGYTALHEYWTGIDEMEATKYRAKAQKYAAQKSENPQTIPRITQRQQALQRAAILENLQLRSEQEAQKTRKRLYDGYTALVEFWTGIDETKATEFRAKAADQDVEVHPVERQETPKQQFAEKNESSLSKSETKQIEPKADVPTSIEPKNACDHLRCVIL